MVIVAIESSSLVASVAIIRDDQVLFESSIQVGTVYAEQLPVILDSALTDIDLTMQQIDGIAVSIGPGSYTGLRVGLSLAKGLAYTSGKPLLSVPTLDAVAYHVPYCQYPVCVVLDARRQKIYTAHYHTASGLPERQTPYEATTIDVLLEKITTPTVFAGTGVSAYGTIIQTRLGKKAHFLPDGLASLSAVPVAFLGRTALQQDEQASLYEVEPMYLRHPVFSKHHAEPPASPSKTLES